MAFKQITFNYPKPDEYLGQFDNEQLQGTHTYDGPGRYVDFRQRN